MSKKIKLSNTYKMKKNNFILDDQDTDEQNLTFDYKKAAVTKNRVSYNQKKTDYLQSK